MSVGNLDIKLTIKKAIQEYYADRADVAAVYLFGSTVGAGFSAHSDIDIGVLYNSGCSPSWGDHLRDQVELSDRLQREVDLVSLNQASPILGYQVLKPGYCLFCSNQRAANEFFVRTLNEYFDLKMSRQVIEHSLQNVRIV